ncbi:MAG: hypothetical protein GTN38_00820 [Candidatus Aenigmarchaeota archaeon]|nr:hypothetical protein [Candidatus Aenigmarchaeota archaeon]NIP40129.1 hypothetical protein [Candidatus Aenigmarchaeota archaeon]NIQ18206.1 hypothetical protein [Candidatus Aenigmarchaeota archaeon]NIS72963.1 hypothetical protein [Candidatus Aenigmarchaeota archaeon]
MDWKLHLILSFILYFAIILISPLSLAYSVQALIILIFSSLLPDLDHPKSLIRIAIFAVVFYLLMVFVIIQDLALEVKILTIVILLILTYYSYKHLPLKHRGKHSLHLWRYPFLFTAVFSVLFAIANINISLILFILIGYGSHLFADRIKKF